MDPFIIRHPKGHTVPRLVGKFIFSFTKLLELYKSLGSDIYLLVLNFVTKIIKKESVGKLYK